MLMSQQYGMEPQQLLAALQENNQLPAMFADVRRGLAVAQVVEGATVTDSNGDVVDTTEFFGRAVTRPRARRSTPKFQPKKKLQPTPKTRKLPTPSDAVSERGLSRECARCRLVSVGEC